MTARPRVLIVGAGGQLGTELRQSFAGAYQLVAVDKEVVDLAVPDQIRAAVRRTEPDVILNAAAYTAVDRAESEPEIAMAINGRAPAILAEEAQSAGALLVHYSTDYVFDGSKSGFWTEEDIPNPLNVYGATKLSGEEGIRAAGGRFLIFRTSWVYGPHGKNFLLTMLRLGRERDRLTVVDDQIGAPTTSLELARTTRTIVDDVLGGRHGESGEWAGLYHMTCGGSTSWCGFAQAIFARAGELLADRRPEVAPISASEYPTPARRPHNSVLSNVLLQRRFGVQLASWESGLDDVLRVLKAEHAPEEVR